MYVKDCLIASPKETSMKKYSLILLLVIIGLFLSSEVLAQRRSSQFRGRRSSFSKNKQYFSIGGSLNAVNYYGDLAPKSHIGSTKLSLTRPSIGLTGTKRIGPQSTVRVSLMWARLLGDDAKSNPFGEDSKYRYMRNQQFRNDIKEFSFEYVFDLIRHQRTFMTRPELVPYLTVGASLFHHNPKAKVPELDAVHFDINNAQPIRENDPNYGGVSPGDWVALRTLGPEGQYVEGSGVKPYSNWQLAIPLGVGLRYKLNRYVDFSFEIAYHQTFTDYVDDVSGFYMNPDDFGQGPDANLARLMANRSKEPFAVISGEQRITEVFASNGTTNYGRVPAEFGGEPYELIRGFGHAHKDNIRGKDDFDVYLVTKFQVTYILGSNIKNAKFR